MKKWIALNVLALLAIASVAIAANWPKHPELSRAHTQLDNALASLKAANDHEKSEFGGHRAKAEQLVHQAQKEIEESVEWANSHH